MMKKAACLILALCFMFVLGAPAFAAENDAGEEAAQYTVSVLPGAHYTATVTELTLTDGEAAKVTLVPDTGYRVGALSIVYGEASGTIPFDAYSALIGGQRFSVTRRADGAAVLSLPKVHANVEVSAVSEDTIRYITVNTAKNIESDKEGLNIVRDLDAFTLRYDPQNGTEISAVTIRTARGEYVFHLNDPAVQTGDFWYSTSGLILDNVTMQYDRKGRLEVRIARVVEDMGIFVNADRHTVSVSADKGITAETGDREVRTHDSYSLRFTVQQPFALEKVTLRCESETYELHARDGAVVRPYGKRWILTEDAEGWLLTLEDVTSDVDIDLISDYSEKANLKVTVSSSHADVTYTGKNPFTAGDETTVSVKTDNGYIVKKATFKMGRYAASVTPFEAYLKLGEVELPVHWTDNGAFTVSVPLTASLNVTVTTEKGARITPDYSVPEPVTSVILHPAYMQGYGNGYFGPADILTRAQVIALLNRAVLNVPDSDCASFARANIYRDVPSGAWYAGPVNMAYAKGLLSIYGRTGDGFMPNAPVTRAEYIVLMCKYKGIEPAPAVKDVFSDVPRTHWAAAYLAYAVEQKWIQGTGNNQFEPERSVTRAEICTATNRLLNRKADLSALSRLQPLYIDVPVTHWAYTEIAEASYTHYCTVSASAERWQ